MLDHHAEETCRGGRNPTDRTGSDRKHLQRSIDRSSRLNHLQGIITNPRLIEDGHALFANHPRLKVHVGPVKYMIESFANNLLGAIRAYSQENEATLTEIFLPNENVATTVTTITYEQFTDGLRRAKIPYPKPSIADIMKHLVSDAL